MVWVPSLKQKFLVCIDNVFSEAGTSKYGVQQGPILGPLFFLLYVSDLPKSYILKSIFYQHEDVKKIENVLNKEFSSLYQWFIDNNTIINKRTLEK